MGEIRQDRMSLREELLRRKKTLPKQRSFSGNENSGLAQDFLYLTKV